MKPLMSFVTILLFASTAMGQVVKQNLEGPQGPVGFGDLVEIKTNIEIKKDADGKPTHTIIWRVPREYRKKVRYYENGTILVLPTGCKATTIEIDVQVIDWVNRTVPQGTFVVEVRGSTKDDPGDAPGEPTDPPETNSPLYKVVIAEYSKVADDDRSKWGSKMAANFGYIAGQVKNKKYRSYKEMMTEVRNANLGKLKGGEPWPEESRRLWLNFRTAIARELDSLKDDGKLKTVDDYYIHWKAIESALNLAILEEGI